MSALATANPIDVAHRVIQASINWPSLPTMMQAKVLVDNFVFIKVPSTKRSLAIVQAIILVVLVVILFLGSLGQPARLL